MPVEDQDNRYAINVADVTKVYRLYEKPIDRLKESVSISHKNYHRDFYALNQLSFQVKKGETVGIIGTNGSGKSTILEVITGVLTPITGQVGVNGKISALLELGAGLNMDYTRIENIYMNDTMMGYTRKEMNVKFQDILDFTEIGDFVYQPVKTYSSGISVRLTFALAINVDPEILIVDEALPVGDVFFQTKYYYRIEEIRQKGTTILMMTHDIRSIIKYCDKVVLLNKDEFMSEGEPDRMVDLYKKILAGQTDSLKAELDREKAEDPAGMSGLSGGMGLDQKKGGHVTGQLMKDQLTINFDRTEYGDGRVEVYDLGLFGERGNITNLLPRGEMFTIKECIRFNTEIDAPIFTYTIKGKKGTDLTGTNTMFEGTDIKPVKNGDEYTMEFAQKMTLQGGEYLLSTSRTGFEHREHVMYHRLYNVTNIIVISNKNIVGAYDTESQVRAEKKSSDS